MDTLYRHDKKWVIKTDKNTYLIVKMFPLKVFLRIQVILLPNTSKKGKNSHNIIITNFTETIFQQPFKKDSTLVQSHQIKFQQILKALCTYTSFLR